MLFRQIIHEDLGCASYLVADRESGVAVVVDPQWEVEPYRRLARLHGVRIGHILETHNHADHVSGHGRLRRQTGAVIHVHELAAAEYEHEPFTDGWRLTLGDLTVEAIERVGAETFIYGTRRQELQGIAANPGELPAGEVIVRIPGAVAPAIGERIRAIAPREKLHLFSADGRKRVDL